MKMIEGCNFQANVKTAETSFWASPNHLLCNVDERTLMKLVVDQESDRVLGAHMVGADAGEICQGLGIALKMGATKADFDACVAIHPTAAEEFVTMFPWGLGSQVSGAKVSPLNGAATPEPVIDN